MSAAGHGTTATGKGVLMNNILRPLFGMAHTTVRRMEELNEQYNHFMQSTFIVFVDEVQTKVLNNEKGVMAKLKNFITEREKVEKKDLINSPFTVIHPQGIRGVFSKTEIDEILQLTERLAA